MQKIRAILVDDEESARDVLENLLVRFCPEVELLAKCDSLVNAVGAIKHLKPALVFLDISLPNYAGYEIVSFFDEIDFEIIFITAYDQFALRAFEIAAIDYLLKPIDIERLKKAVFKVAKKSQITEQAQRLSLLNSTLTSSKISSIVVTDRGMQHLIAVNQIIAIEAQEAYCTIYTKEKNFTVSKNLKHFEKLFEDVPQFFRTHKSWLLNKVYILNYSKSGLTVKLSNNITAKLSKYRKADFEKDLLN